MSMKPIFAFSRSRASLSSELTVSRALALFFELGNAKDGKSEFPEAKERRRSARLPNTIPQREVARSKRRVRDSHLLTSGVFPSHERHRQGHRAVWDARTLPDAAKVEAKTFGFGGKISDYR
eukprot:scaffold1459_cov260-Pinguiococcus_pyrenoidosus.AAC.1